MLLKIGGPYLGYRNGDVIEVDDAEGRKIVEKLGADTGRVEILGDLREPLRAVPEIDTSPSDDERAAAEEEALLAEIANEEAAAAAATADDS